MAKPRLRGQLIKRQPLRAASFAVRISWLGEAQFSKLLALIWVLLSASPQHRTRELIRHASRNFLPFCCRAAIREIAQRYPIRFFGHSSIFARYCVIQTNDDAHAGRILLIACEAIGPTDIHNVLGPDSRCVLSHRWRPVCVGIHRPGFNSCFDARSVHSVCELAIERLAYRFGGVRGRIRRSRTQNPNAVDFLFEITIGGKYQNGTDFLLRPRVRR